MTFKLFDSMFNLLHPPAASTEDAKLVAALDRHTDATREVVARASNVDRVLSNIQEAGEGLFA